MENLGNEGGKKQVGTSQETLQKFIANLKSLGADFIQKLDLNQTVSFSDYPTMGVCIRACFLVGNSEGRALLQSSPALLKQFLRCDINAGPEEGPYKGTTVAWWLLGGPKGRALLQSSPALLKQFLRCDMNAAPEEGDNKGKTIAWFLAGTLEGRALLQSSPELLKQFSSCDMNAAPEEGPYKGMTIAWFLAGTLEGRALLQSSPELLKQFSSCDMNAAPEEGDDKGKTVAWFLAANDEGLNIVKCLFLLLPTLNFNQYEGIDVDKNKTLTEMKNSLKMSFERAHNGAVSASICGDLPNELYLNIFIKVLIGEHHELRFIQSFVRKGEDTIEKLCRAYTIDTKKLGMLIKCYSTGTVSFWMKSREPMKRQPTINGNGPSQELESTNEDEIAVKNGDSNSNNDDIYGGSIGSPSKLPNMANYIS